MIRAALALLLVTLAPPAVAREPHARAEVPIRAVMLSDGVRRYAVTLRINGRLVEAGLDTGSTGLRVLPRALSPERAEAHGAATSYFYGSGTKFDGVRSDAIVGIGVGGDAAVPIQRIDRIGCTRVRPDCPAAQADPATLGIQGDGIAGQGFAAILGIGLRADAVPNPFEALGITRWIVELPRPGERAGRLILNPDASETAGFQTVPVLPQSDAVPGCIIGPDRLLGRWCGSARLDTGTPGLRVVLPRGHAPVPQGTPATLAIGDGAQVASFDVTLGRRDQAAGFRFDQKADARSPQLFFGIAPYFVWSVLYELDAHTIGVKPRAPATGE